MRCFFLLFPALLAAQEFTLRTLPAGSTAPAPRIDGAVAYDESARRLIVFGGRATTTRNDLWAYDLEQQAWSELRPSGTPPAARFGHTLVYDAARQRLLVFGGQASGFFSDTWAYDLQRNTWQQLAPDNAGPSKRYGHSAVLDAARNRMIISHGFTDAGRFDDTWAFDLNTNRWTNISPSSARPLKRCLHHAVLDAPGNQMLLYGGCASGFGPCPLGDLWSFDLQTHRWTEMRTGTAPPPRQWYGMAFDSEQRRLLLHAGSGELGTLADTWEFDARARSWARLMPAGTAAPRMRHEATLVPGLGPVFFGGSTDGGLSNDLLLLTRQLTLSPGAVLTFSVSTGVSEPLTAMFNEAGELPRELGGITVEIDGLAAPLFEVTPDRLTLQVPYETRLAGLAQIQIHRGGGTLQTLPAMVRPTSPVLLAATPASEDIVVLFATGLGAVVPAIPTGRAATEPYPTPADPIIVRINNQPAEILFAGLAPGTVGLFQLNVRSTAAGTPGRVEITLRAGGNEVSAGFETR